MSTYKGMRFQSTLVPLINRYWPDSLSLGKQGVNDKGDFHMPGNRGERGYIIEAKNCKTIELAKWQREAEVEAKNKGVPFGVVVHKRRGTQDPAKQWVTMEFGTFLKLVHGEPVDG